MYAVNANGKKIWLDEAKPFTIDDWEGAYRETVNEIVINAKGEGFKIKPNQPINTSIFEEAIIDEL